MDERKYDEPKYDDFDRRLIGALHNVEVPADLHARLQRALQNSVAEPELQTSSLHKSASATTASATSDARTGTVATRQRSALWNRRTAIAAAVAAGLGGTIFGYRHLTQPLSQAWLEKSTQSLLAQIQQAGWQPLDESEVVAVKRSLMDLGFLRYVHGVTFDGSCELHPPRDVQSARAFNLGSELVLLELQIDRGVQGLSSTLNDLAWSRSDSVAYAMSSGNRTLVFTGPANIRGHILRARTT